MSAAYQLSGYRNVVSPRRRAASLALALVAVVLLIFMLIELGWQPPRLREPSGGAVSFALAPAEQATQKAKTVAKPKHAAKSAAAPPKRMAMVVPHERPPTPPKMIVLNKDAFAATDISHLPSHDEDKEETADAADAGASGGGAVYGPGEGPGGARMWNAEWYVEPGHAALAGYMPSSGAPPGSWAMIACKTLPKYHVDDCRELGESPVGSGLSRALRQAAWQFLVRPPRIGGKPLIGVWVRIRFDFREANGKDE